MPIEGVYTAEEQRQLVYEYLCVPYGSKARFLAERGVSSTVLRRWRKLVFAGSVEHGLVPRGGGVVSVEETQALKKLLQENQALREQLARRDAEHQRELAGRDEELAIQHRAVDALGKAIEILHSSGSKNSPGSAANEHPPPPGHR